MADPMPAPSMTMPASASPRATRLRHTGRRCRDSPPAPCHRSPDRRPPARAPRRCCTMRLLESDARVIGRRWRRGGYRPPAPDPPGATDPTDPAGTTETRRAVSVSRASGVTCPPAASSTVAPYSIARASASVMISNRRVIYHSARWGPSPFPTSLRARAAFGGSPSPSLAAAGAVEPLTEGPSYCSSTAMYGRLRYFSAKSSP